MKKTEIIEALLFVTGNPVKKQQFQEILKDLSSKEIEMSIRALNEEYENTGRSFRIEEIAGGWQMRTRSEFSPWIKMLISIQRRERLSKPALETLAVIAYKQPVTKADMEAIRGVNVDGVLNSLIEKSLVRVCGKKDAPGRPFLYGTTTRFLEHFGLASLKDLPKADELRNPLHEGERG